MKTERFILLKHFFFKERKQEKMQSINFALTQLQLQLQLELWLWVWVGSELPFFIEGKEFVLWGSFCRGGVGDFSTAPSDWTILCQSFLCLR